MRDLRVSTTTAGEIEIWQDTDSQEAQCVSISLEQVDILARWLEEARDELTSTPN